MPNVARLMLGNAALLVSLGAVVGSFIATPAHAAARYIAWLEDGTRLTARTLPTWPMPGVAYRFDSQDLLASSNPVRLMRDRLAEVELLPPYLVLANGDVLTGTPTQLEPDEGRVGL